MSNTHAHTDGYLSYRVITRHLTIVPVITGLYQDPYSLYNTQQLVSIQSMGMMAHKREDEANGGLTTVLLYPTCSLK